jgi:hypothetical protein
MTRQDVYKNIDSERDHQDKKWGTIADHPHDVGAWLTIMRKYLNDADIAHCNHIGDEEALDEITKVVSIGIACGEQHGFRHRSKFSAAKKLSD